jgi:hypothetical protein
VPHFGATPQHFGEMRNLDAESGLTFFATGKSSKLSRFEPSEARNG